MSTVKEGIMISNFLKKYDPTNDLKFDAVTYKPNSLFTKNGHLGIIVDDPELVAIGKPVYFHLGVDRCTPNTLKAPILAAFDGVVNFYTKLAGYETFIVLDIDGADFVVRSAHCEKMEVPNGTFVKAGTLLGYEGNVGIGTGRHTHTEIVSKGENSVICDYILDKKGKLNEEDHFNYLLEELSKNYKLNKDKIDFMLDYKKKHDLRFINTFMVKRRNSAFDREMKTFYSSDIMFNGM
jgi:murein DD-endopeptidase MepM/ murein hydrolase activator NlpD